jgi:hypothetical protein
MVQYHSRVNSSHDAGLVHSTNLNAMKVTTYLKPLLPEN